MVRALLLSVIAACLSRAAAAQDGRFERVVLAMMAAPASAGLSAELIEDLAGRYRPASALGAREEVAVVNAMLSRVAVSHLALLSDSTYRHLLSELEGRDEPTVGAELVCIGGRFFADAVLDGGPAARAGLLRGDRVLSIDGRAPGRSPRLDARSDDASLPDPATHGLLASAGETVSFVVERQRDEILEIDVPVSPYSALRASRASISTVTLGGHRFGYFHLWYVFERDAARLVREALERFGGRDGVILDLRGRGGNGAQCGAILRELSGPRVPRPLAVLIDGRTRSAKEILAFEIQRRRLGVLVGEPTAGAVVSCAFSRIDEGSVLMRPDARVAFYSDMLEGTGVAPDVVAADALRWSEGADPILEAAAVHLARAAER
ncbi:MAG: hypothetical protein Fur0037_11070 [Planctomycetota bacterium]